MLRLLIKALFLASPLWFLGCGLISFEHANITTHPDSRNFVLEADDNIWIDFPADADRTSSESIVNISGPGGAAKLDLKWDRNRLYCIPVPALVTGARYVLEASGTVLLGSGGSFVAHEIVPFFAGTRNGLLSLSSFSPEQGAFVSTDCPIDFSFNKPMNQTLFEAAFGLRPSVPFRFEWGSGGDQVKILPKTTWLNLTTYTWTISNTLVALDSSGVLEDWTGTFRTQSDIIPPAVLSIHPAAKDTYVPLMLPLTQSKADDWILITLSEEVPAESISQAFSLTPTVRGIMCRVSPAVFVYKTTEKYEMGRSYALTIDTGLRDLAGNNLVQNWSTVFMPDIPIQSISEISTLGEGPWTVFNSASAVDFAITDSKVQVKIVFAHGYGKAAQTRIPRAIKFEGYFPSSVGSPTLYSVSWPVNTTLLLSYTGIQSSANDLWRFYRLTIPASSATADEDGSNLEKETWLMLRAKK